MTLPNQDRDAIRAAAEEQYLVTVREIERKRLEISRTARQQAALVAEVKALESTAAELRRAALGETDE